VRAVTAGRETDPGLVGDKPPVASFLVLRRRTGRFVTSDRPRQGATGSSGGPRVERGASVVDQRAASVGSARCGGDPYVPGSTYRVQLNAGFTFEDARAIVPYLADLGIGALYASPYLKATPGSSHGYDVVDYGALNPEVGDEASHAALVATLHEHGMGHLVDFVPNHMGIAEGSNAWWLDVLENGQTSAYAEFFDIDWRPLKPELRGKVLLPILGDHYGVVLEKGELQLGFADGAFTVCYYATPLPIAPPTYPTVLRHPLPELADVFAPDDLNFLEFQSIVTAFERLAPQDEQDPDLVAERRREQIVTRRRLADLVAASAVVAEAVAGAVAAFNGTAGDARSFDLLDGLLSEQTYRLSSFRTAAEEINYRRFFAINELASVRQEVPAVFEAAHALLLRLIAEGKVDGVRIDHPDGLWDPAGYFRQLQNAAAQIHRGPGIDDETADAARAEMPVTATRCPPRPSPGDDDPRHLPAGREDPRARRGVARRLGGRRHRRLRVRPPRHRALHRPGEPQTVRRPLRPLRRVQNRLRRPRLPEEEADPADRPRLRGQRPGAGAQPHLRARPADPRLHALLAARRPARDHRLLPGLPQLHRL
jgi:hypothetical protein